MIHGRTLLFYEPLTPKHYLDQILKQYPYDIDSTLVYTLLTKHPSPHPALLTFIDFICKSRKYLITRKSYANQELHHLYHKMAALAQPSHALYHVHSFCFDCLLHTTHSAIQPAYPYLAYDKIAMIDEIQMALNPHIYLNHHPASTPISYISTMPLLDLSLDPDQYFALSISMHEVHGLILLPRYAAALIPALSTLYPFTTETVQHDFLLFYAVKTPQKENIITYDANRKQYLGCSCHTQENELSFTECLHMIRTLYAAITRAKHDLTLTASMLHIQRNDQIISLLLCGDDEKQKSALSEALLEYGRIHNASVIRVFENVGTIHLLDDSLYATGTQCGVTIAMSSLIPHPYHDNFGTDLYLSEGDHTTYRITPLKASTNKQEFQPIHSIAILCDVESFHLFQQAETVLTHIRRCYCHLTASHNEDTIGNELINTAFLNNIPLIALPADDDPRQNAQLLITWLQDKLCADE